MVRHTEKAFKWIVSLLKGRNIPFVISWGLAARGYGAKRLLADIDIVMPEERFGEIYHDFVPFSFYGPAQYKDDNWDIFLTSLEYEGQEIDLCSARYKIFDSHVKTWFAKQRNLELFNTIEIYGEQVPVVTKKSLIEEKIQLDRKVDREDVTELCATDQGASALISKVRSLGFSRGQYAVFGSGPMTVRGIRPSNDIDIVVSAGLYEKCLHNGFEERHSNGVLKLVKGEFEFYRDWDFKGYRPDVKTLISGAELIGGVPFVSLEEVVKWKKVYDREKDKQDVRSIDEYLSMAGVGIKLG